MTHPTATEIARHRALGGGVEVWDTASCRWVCTEIGGGFDAWVADPNAPQVGMRLVPLPSRHFRPGERVHHVNDPTVKFVVASEVDCDGIVLVCDPEVPDYVHPIRYGVLTLDFGHCRQGLPGQALHPNACNHDINE